MYRGPRFQVWFCKQVLQFYILVNREGPIYMICFVGWFCSFIFLCVDTPCFIFLFGQWGSAFYFLMHWGFPSFFSIKGSHNFILLYMMASFSFFVWMTGFTIVIFWCTGPSVFNFFVELTGLIILFSGAQGRLFSFLFWL